MDEHNLKCCFCGGKVIWGINSNDPRPIKIDNDDLPVCCDECNAKIVIPTRISIWPLDDKINFLENLFKDIDKYNTRIQQEITKYKEHFGGTKK